MLRTTHWLIVVAYLAAPVVAAAWVLFSRARKPGRGTRSMLTLSIAIVCGSALALSCAFAVGGRASAMQVGLCVYLTMSLILLLSAMDRMLIAVLRRIWHFATGDSAAATLWRKLVESLPFLIRATVLIALALPYLMAIALTYRPKVLPRDDPASQLGLNYERVEFQTSDGFTIRGWFIPVAPQRRTPQPRQQHRFGRDTVVICHGIGSNKSATLSLAQSLVPQGYNVLMFDFRGHGESDGQLTSLGDLERKDVLAAVGWVRSAHPRQAQRVLGLGVSTGAAALIEAAADPSPEGRSIDAVAVLEAFDNLSGLGKTVAQTRFLPPLSWVADRVGLALASAQVGTDLVHFAPADAVKDIWPRPILIIHGGNDAVIPFEHGQRLFDAAVEPKRCLWLPGEDYGQAIHSKSAARAVREFFDEAQSVPAI